MSVPNQKIVKIHKPKYKEYFLQIGIDEWQEALRIMTKAEFALYLYLAGNANGFNLELSRQAFENATGYKKTAYSDAVNKLIQLGYIVHKGGNFYHFYTSPLRESERAQNFNFSDGLFSGKESTIFRSPISEKSETLYRPSNTEIDNINKKDKVINNAFHNQKENKPYIPARKKYDSRTMTTADMVERMRLGF